MKTVYISKNETGIFHSNPNCSHLPNSIEKTTLSKISPLSPYRECYFCEHFRDTTNAINYLIMGIIGTIFFLICAISTQIWGFIWGVIIFGSWIIGGIFEFDMKDQLNPYSNSEDSVEDSESLQFDLSKELY